MPDNVDSPVPEKASAAPVNERETVKEESQKERSEIAAEVKEEMPERAKIKVDDAYVRAESVRGEVIAQLKAGTSLRIALSEQGEDGHVWYDVDNENGIVGWIRDDMLVLETKKERVEREKKDNEAKEASKVELAKQLDKLIKSLKNVSRPYRIIFPDDTELAYIPQLGIGRYGFTSDEESPGTCAKIENNNYIFDDDDEWFGSDYRQVVEMIQGFLDGKSGALEMEVGNHVGYYAVSDDYEREEIWDNKIHNPEERLLLEAKMLPEQKAALKKRNESLKALDKKMRELKTIDLNLSNQLSFPPGPDLEVDNKIVNFIANGSDLLEINLYEKGGSKLISLNFEQSDFMGDAAGIVLNYSTGMDVDKKIQEYIDRIGKILDERKDPEKNAIDVAVLDTPDTKKNKGLNLRRTCNYPYDSLAQRDDDRITKIPVGTHLKLLTRTGSLSEDKKYHQDFAFVEYVDKEGKKLRGWVSNEYLSPK